MKTGPAVTILTPQGRGAIGVVRAWGPGALAVADAAFRPARGVGLSQTEPGRLRLGRIGQGLGDEVVAVVLDGDPPSVEIQCHGGPVAIALVVDALRDAGAEVAEPEAWATSQADSSIQAEALVDLSRAPTLRTAEILLEQAQGALDRELARVVAAISTDRPAALEILERLIASARVGLRLIRGWRVVISGRPNVGKSRLLNALAGYQRAIVDPTPGTTRDLVTLTTAFEGWPVELVDTAGLRTTDDAIERSGIDRAVRQTESADLVLKVLDRSEPLQLEDLELIDTPVPALLVANKADLPAAWSLADSRFSTMEILSISAEQGEGLDRLIAAMVARLVPSPPEAGSGVPFREGQVTRLQNALEALRAGSIERAIQELAPSGR